jgi:AraC-like DNA-binding protein
MQERLRLVRFRLLTMRREDRRQIGQLALQAGFRDISTFYKAFRREVGQSPRRWLQSRQQ